MIDINEINNFLTPELCEDAGIIVINISDQSLDLGAMNLDYIKVKNVINPISFFLFKISLRRYEKFISSLSLSLINLLGSL